MTGSRRPRQFLLIGLGVALLFSASAYGRPGPNPHPVMEPPSQRLVDMSRDWPMRFEENQGQTDPQVRFMSRGRGYTVFLTPTEAVLALRQAAASSSQPAGDALPSITETNAVGSSPPTVLRMKLRNVDPDPEMTGLEPLPGRTHYFTGSDPAKWRTNVRQYARVEYQDVYPGIDLVYYGTSQRQLEYDFIVAPGADPSVIGLEFEGADRLEVNAQGHLAVQLSNGEVRFHRPYVYQEASGERQEIGGSYLLEGETEVAFEVAAYDTSRPLVIDPVLGYSTYLGGSETDTAADIAVDAAGNAYVTGYALSENFPITVNAYQPEQAGGLFDMYVAKLNADGSALVYATYLGGDHYDYGFGITVDLAGNAYVTGRTSSTDFPTTDNAFQRVLAGGGNAGAPYDAFVAKLNPDGSDLVYSTYLGGSNSEWASEIAVDSAGDAYVAGLVFWGGFPVTAKAFQTAYGGWWSDAFVTKLNSDGSALVYSTYLGGNESDGANGIAVDTAGNAYVTGGTYATDFPTATPMQGASGGAADGFVTKLNADGSTLVYSTYLGGSNHEQSFNIAVDPDGHAYVTGSTASTDFPTANPLQPAYGGGDHDGFVAKLSFDGSAFVYSTYLGGSSWDQSSSVAVESGGNAHVTGRTTSTDFPTTANALQGALAGGADAFVAELSPDGSALIHCTYLGGSGVEDAFPSIALDSVGRVYVTGQTTSTDFPTSASAFQPAHAGGDWDGFVVRLEGVIAVEIDIKPGSFPNSVNLGSHGGVPVAIFGTPAFDASTVDELSLSLAGAAVRLKGKGTPMASLEDVNDDGLLDLVVHVSTEALELSEGDIEAVLEGMTLDGAPIRGTDSVRIVP